MAAHASPTASQTSRAKSTSVAEKLSGEYSKRICVPGTLFILDWICFVPRTAMSTTPCLLMPNVIRRWAGEVELYKWTMARGQPANDSNVRWISSSFDWTRTCTQTSSGMRFSSIRRRVKSNSICDAEGKPISISLNPSFTSKAK